MARFKYSVERTSVIVVEVEAPDEDMAESILEASISNGELTSELDNYDTYEWGATNPDALSDITLYAD